jgi:uncharacterized protein (DUF924 family)
MDEARSVREFWFGKLPLSPEALAERMDFWFGGDGSQLTIRDEEIRARFGALLEQATAGRLESWGDGPRRRLSLIILLDQFPRNIFRGTPRAFAWDAKALALTLSGMQSGADAALDAIERIFFYIPLQHAESPEVQDESVAAYRRLVAEAPADLRESFEEVLGHAEHHRSIIERFGRFPHRNRSLGRESTAAEQTWLRESGERFGQ